MALGLVVALLEGDPGSCTDGELADAVLALFHQRDRIEAALARYLDGFDARLLHAADGARTPGGWLGARAEVTRKAGAALVHQARDLRSCPHVAEAFRTGRLGSAKVRLLLTARRVYARLFAEHEAGLVEEIAPLTVDDAAKAIAHWMALAEATKAFDEAGDDEPEPIEPDPAVGNSLFLSQTLDGRWRGEFDLDPVAGAGVAGALSARIDDLFRQGTYQADDGLPACRRRADALEELVLRGSDPTRTEHGDIRPSVAIELDEHTLAGVAASSLADGMARRCQLLDGTPISRSAAERCLCNARIHALATRLLEDGTIEVIGVTDLQRDANRKQRRALRRRDGGCAYPGCSAPPNWCEAHHIHPAEDAGPTVLQNLVLLCRHHHHLIHEGGHQLWRTDDGYVHVLRPDGTPLPVVRAGHKVLDPDRGGPTEPDQPWPPPPHANGPLPGPRQGSRQGPGHGPPRRIPPTRFTSLTHTG